LTAITICDHKCYHARDGRTLWQRRAANSRIVSVIGPKSVLGMATDDKTDLGESLRRKLRGVVALLQDPAATEHERANAEALKKRLEKILKQRGVPSGDWSDIVFRLGRGVKKAVRSTAPPVPTGGWTDTAFRAGRTLRQAIKKVRSD
jgi:hypothetical protein